jgi:hypothetical protein
MRAYWVGDNDEGYGYAVVADRESEAKSLARHCDGLCDMDWVDLRCHVIKDANIEGLGKGVMEDYIEGLKRGLYNHVIGETCPKCKREDVKVQYDNGFFCDCCEDEEEKDEPK